ncbi:maleylpyruvate isomerase family mycothiol-dependent enzyme [Frankia sp. CNm7]|nr:maleylpyruvate isomerase family mycothiol-dependent enzyme [Frankia nepalensis]MBL7500797.1 maleylpyruvate isomerase family mycothiol-dependent enzyme [Frankia nepalensis]MBL7512604.1 maleylpyruvate isomerase family mycothiol-dependent enzyme [Frankia nepalensis]MBL7523044.1 maleylpyruvate isomerase family mycothiol-dependent enzyme [Frankia nepalensis]
MTTDDVGLQPLVARSYLALADVLDPLSDDRWDTPSLCAGWRVREVVAHLTMAARYSERAFLAELRACDFDFSRLSDLIAGRDARLPTAELVANLRREVMHRWTPPDGGHRGALSHVVIHGLDITVPLGVPRLAADEAMVVVLDSLGAEGGARHFGVDLAGRRLEATDLDWSFGAGQPLRGPAEDLVLLLAGRSPMADS